ncbi:MAG TPA: diaminopimelate epimerase [Bryobacteraceae bacterium]
MIALPFVKAHGARNDFLLTWRDRLPPGIADLPSMARAICDRHSGAGADGWMLLSSISDAAAPVHAALELWNSDGSPSEISGNGTRCAAAVLIWEGRADPGFPPEGEAGKDIRIRTGAGVKTLKLLERHGLEFLFEMNMGAAHIEELHWDIDGRREATVLNVGNPQCAVFTPDFDFDFDWRVLGAELESHPRFPHRTNVSFVRVLDRHTVEARFFERGAGATMSSGTGATGAAAAAVARGLVEGPVRVLTPAGPLNFRWEGADILLAGPAEIVARGEFYPGAVVRQ